MLAGLGELKDAARDERPRLVTFFLKLKRAANFLARLAHRLDCVGLEDEETRVRHGVGCLRQP
jgi:hypothetical protein